MFKFACNSLAVAFPFAVFSVACISSTIIHICTHITTVPVLHLLFFLPTLFVPDVLVLCAVRLLLRRDNGLLNALGYWTGCFLAFVTLGAAASQLGFFFETSGELEWREAGSYTTSEEGLKVLLSGSTSVLVSGLFLTTIAWVARNMLYAATGNLLKAVSKLLIFVYETCMRNYRNEEPPAYEVEANAGLLADDVSASSEEDDADYPRDRSILEKADQRLLRPARRYTRYLRAVPPWVVAAVFLCWICLGEILRPAKPYDSMSATLPVSLLAAFTVPSPDYCIEQARLTNNTWPLPDLVRPVLWELPEGDFKGWAPGSNNAYVNRYLNRKVDWLPSDVPSGFARWDPKRFETAVEAPTLPAIVSDPDSNPTTEEEDSSPLPPPSPSPSPFTAVSDEKNPPQKGCLAVTLKDAVYNPVDDPLRIDNLDGPLLSEISRALGDGSVKIRHLVFVLMESTREELFPLQQGSDIHRIILESHPDEDREAANARLSRLTPNGERITGKPGNFGGGPDGTAAYDPPDTPEWDDRTPAGFGGINVVGALTPSSVSTKSIAASHCGVWPMPVDMFEESQTESYQPCLPQLLELFNRKKKKKAPGGGRKAAAAASPSPEDDFREQKWHPAFFQAVTDTYDRQDRFNTKMGFREVVSKDRIQHDNEGKSGADAAKEVNYFGFAEQTLRPYIKDYVAKALAANERIFLSHFTSTTHHPWGTPDRFNTTGYMGAKGGTGWWHKDFDKYLNTVRFQDAWLGELMQMLDDAGIADETLVVFAGDHGQAFKEDVDKTGTYDNGHVSNFRIPITLRHPRIPRVQYHANASTVSLVPTILDLLVSTGSLNPDDARAAADLVHDYEGQSLIRPYKPAHEGRRAWNFGIVNSGGGMLTVTSADAPWRVMLPLGKEVALRFTDLGRDPLELSPMSAWNVDALAGDVGEKYGPDAARWTREAAAVADWWGLERQRLWKYHTKNETAT